MPYNTRRKSLSLPSLGIQLPASSRAHNRNRSLSKAATPRPLQAAQKKTKRSHDSSSSSSYCERTPPPSPGDSDADPSPLPAPLVDTSSVNDDIVVAVIEQLEKTGNRPHLIKELAVALAQSNTTIANSANAAALLSSRLSLFLKRSSWSPSNPCPIAKELIPIHPRKVFFYLTTCPPQAVADDCDDVVVAMMQKHTAVSRDHSEVVSEDDEHSTNSTHDTDADADFDADIDVVGPGPFGRRRSQLSPSPDLELNDGTIFSDTDCDACDVAHHQHHHHHPHQHHSARHPYGVCGGTRRIVALQSSREMTPPLEGDEEEFTRTATSVRQRATDGSGASKTPQRSLPPSRITLDGESDRDAMEAMDWFDMSLMGGQRHDDDDHEHEHGPHSSSSASSAASDIDDARKSTSVQNDDVLKTDASAATDPQGTTTNGRSILSHGLDSNAADVTKKPIPSIFDSSTPLKRPISAVDVVDFETWDDLRNPETVDVDELDEYFKQYS